MSSRTWGSARISQRTIASVVCLGQESSTIAWKRRCSVSYQYSSIEGGEGFLVGVSCLDNQRLVPVHLSANRDAVV